jgi:predicted aspartyl protease
MTILARERVLNLPEGATEAGRFSVRVRLANNVDRDRATAGDIPMTAVRELELDAVVDTGAARLVLPESVAAQLGLPLKGQSRVRYADQSTAVRQVAESVWLEVQGRDGVFKAVLEPQRTDALLGAIVLEDLDLMVDCTTSQLLPRDPTTIITELD